MNDNSGKRNRRYILLVESDRAVAERLTDLIADISTGYEVLRACSGFEGLQKIENARVNVVLAAEKLMDMPGRTFINILQGTKKFKKNEPACVLMAENGSAANIREMDCSASVDVIKNPLNPDELAYSLDRAMDLDGLNGKIQYNKWMGRVLVALIPVVLLVGVAIRAF